MTLYSNAPILQRSTFSSYFCNVEPYDITMVTAVVVYKPFPCEIYILMPQGPVVDHVTITLYIMTSSLTMNTGVPANDVISIFVVN